MGVSIDTPIIVPFVIPSGVEGSLGVTQPGYRA